MDQSPFLPAGAPQDVAPQPPSPEPQPNDINKLADDWRGWINRPDNRAALMQFGIAMLQPMGMGESFLSHTANSVGHAGEAASTVHETEAKRGMEENLADYRDVTSGAKETTAQARMASATNKGSGPSATSTFNANVRRSMAFSKWALAPEDMVGGDNIAKIAGAKNKAELLATPEGRKKARQIFDELGGSAEADLQSSQAGEGVPEATPAPAPTGETTASFRALLANPQMRAGAEAIKARLRANPNDAQAIRAVEQLRIKSNDPDAVDSFMGL